MTGTQPTRAQIRRWRKYLANERAEAAVYRDLARRREGEERAILLALANAEGRHEAHWLRLLGDAAAPRRASDFRTRILGALARQFGSVFVLALAQRAEARSPYAADVDATDTMAADEHIHGEVVRGLAARGRNRLSGTFRAAVFGANDGLVSNLALIAGIGATGVPTSIVVATGIAGLLAGALSMGAGEYVSVRSQRELLAASTPSAGTRDLLPLLDVDANELSLVYRARGMDEETATARAAEVLNNPGEHSSGPFPAVDHEAVGTGAQAALSSFFFFASGAVVPLIPYLFGFGGLPALLAGAVLVGAALLGTGAIVGLLSGGPPLLRALRQLGIGYGAAGVTYVVGLGAATVVG